MSPSPKGSAPSNAMHKGFASRVWNCPNCGELFAVLCAIPNLSVPQMDAVALDELQEQSIFHLLNCQE